MFLNLSKLSNQGLMICEVTEMMSMFDFLYYIFVFINTRLVSQKTTGHFNFNWVFSKDIAIQVLSIKPYQHVRTDHMLLCLERNILFSVLDIFQEFLLISSSFKDGIIDTNIQFSSLKTQKEVSEKLRHTKKALDIRWSAILQILVFLTMAMRSHG